MSKSPTRPDNSNKTTYLSIAVVFFCSGIALMVPESTRATGLPFLILGFTFFTISQDRSNKPKKK